MMIYEYNNMTKLSHKEYVSSIVEMIEDEWKDMIYDKMISQFNLLEKDDDLERIIKRLTSESMNNLSQNLYQFVMEKGVPRKQRTTKKEKL